MKSITLKGIEGLEKIQEIMNTLRENAPTEIGGYQVVSARDYKTDTIKNMETGAVTLDCPVPMCSIMILPMMHGYV